MKTKIFIIVIITAICCNSAAFGQNDEVKRLLVRAQTAYKMENFQDALNEYLKIKAIAPTYPEIYKALGDVYEKMGKDEDLKNAIESYKTYLKLAPNAADKESIKQKVYSLEYMYEKQVQHSQVLDDLSGTWAAIDNFAIVERDKKTGAFTSVCDFIFNISEIKKTGTYRVSILKEGSRYYRETIAEKTVNIIPQKDNSFNFTLVDVQVYTPNQGGYVMGKGLAGVLGNVTGKSWLGDALNAVIDGTQVNDLPSNTQTAYMFALKYIDGKLEGVVNVVQKFANPNQQRTLQDGLYDITFIKFDECNKEMEKCMNNSRLSELSSLEDFLSDNALKKEYPCTAELLKIVDDRPDVITLAYGYKDKWGEKLSNKNIYNKLSSVNSEWGKNYKKYKNQEIAGMVISFVGCGVMIAALPTLAVGLVNEDKHLMNITWGLFGGGAGTALIVGIPIVATVGSKYSKIINDYNNTITRQSRQKPSAQLSLGVSSSGGFGLTLNF